MRRLILAVLLLPVLAALIAVPGILFLNSQLPMRGEFKGRSHAELEGRLGPSLISFTEEAVWARDVSVLGFPLVQKGFRVAFEKDAVAANGLGLALEAEPYWIFYDFLYLNMVYEPGFRRGIFCFALPVRCSVWI